jgi:hypothetical protein
MHLLVLATGCRFGLPAKKVLVDLIPATEAVAMGYSATLDDPCLFHGSLLQNHRGPAGENPRVIGGDAATSLRSSKHAA